MEASLFGLSAPSPWLDGDRPFVVKYSWANLDRSLRCILGVTIPPPHVKELIMTIWSLVRPHRVLNLRGYIWGSYMSNSYIFSIVITIRAELALARYNLPSCRGSRL